MGPRYHARPIRAANFCANSGNRNGIIDDSERGLSGPRGRAGGILLHSSAYGSAGCQTFADFDAFARAVALGSGRTFDYLLIRD